MLRFDSSLRSSLNDRSGLYPVVERAQRVETQQRTESQNGAN